ncbi:4-hydroxybenzoate polyprenyltransferase [Cryobacterium mesophilum]|uniref:1,4-dihydroxy-2-naphthoate prenyltransferase n=1 Tax=Terrimesophilobacter mesophilus TaxID=433647 RepID=A0A4R8VBB7_9MICO|nr:UbiA family prenyltransferase [Terrimesophilobacter mesophilus]MBB5632289.1 4-hydroxybenzoate polyprenyltransferase [Terrimesophilobacter mesophilus]TFB79137.1 1,4-dihydroxy-2-naphthoate prenyltransferase [Terrimesophilobacter mesophilus]
MPIDRQHPALALAFALARSTHPGPTLAVTLVTVLLGAGAGLEPWRLIVLGAAMLMGQTSVGLSNDWLDADRDRAAGRTDKPVARGDVGGSVVRGTAFATVLLAIALTLPLGIPATIAHALFIAAGWGYNLWFKFSALSVLPYVVGFGALPAIVTLALPSPALPAPWALAAGALLGVSAHFANALPDLDADRETGVVGLPHRFGVRASAIVTFAALAAASGLVVFGPGMAHPVGWVALGLESMIAVTGGVLAITRSPARPLFRLVILGALVAVAALVLSGSSLVR